MKQSLKAYKPLLNEAKEFDSFIKENHAGKLMIAHCYGDMKRSKISDAYNKGEEALILIGPEGDFTRKEVEETMSKKFTQIHLGPSRLRTETAGVAACHSIYFINQ